MGLKTHKQTGVRRVCTPLLTLECERGSAEEQR